MDNTIAKGNSGVHRVIVPGQCVRLSVETARVAIPGQQAPSEPRIEVIRQGDVVQAIDVTCCCGQHIRIHCQYHNPA